MFVRNCWYVAGWDSDIVGDGFHTITIIDQPLVMFREAGGGLVALENRCCHRFAPLSKGRIEDGCNVRCMYHGLKFAPDGACISVPGQDTIPETARVRSYPAESRYGWAWVWMGDPEKADPSLIPSLVGIDDARYRFRTGSLDYNVDYQLINDNLTDFSHLSYVHANSFGASEYWASIRPMVRRIERGIRVSRWVSTESGEVMSEEAPTVKLRPKGVGPTAMFQTYDYLVPGIMVMRSETYRLADMPEDGVSFPDAEPVAATLTCQAVTPIGKRKSRYFFTWGPRVQDGDDAAADNMITLARRAFAEDHEMIEAQQAIIDQCGPSREVLTTADVVRVQLRATIRSLYREENPKATESIPDTADNPQEIA